MFTHSNLDQQAEFSNRFFDNELTFGSFINRLKYGLKNLNMIYHSTHFNDFLWYLILHESFFKKKTPED